MKFERRNESQKMYTRFSCRVQRKANKQTKKKLINNVWLAKVSLEFLAANLT